MIFYFSFSRLKEDSELEINCIFNISYLWLWRERKFTTCYASVWNDNKSLARADKVNHKNWRCNQESWVRNEEIDIDCEFSSGFSKNYNFRLFNRFIWLLE